MHTIQQNPTSEMIPNGQLRKTCGPRPSLHYPFPALTYAQPYHAQCVLTTVRIIVDNRRINCEEIRGHPPENQHAAFMLTGAQYDRMSLIEDMHTPRGTQTVLQEHRAKAKWRLPRQGTCSQLTLMLQRNAPHALGLLLHTRLQSWRPVAVDIPNFPQYTTQCYRLGHFAFRWGSTFRDSGLTPHRGGFNFGSFTCPNEK